MANLFSKPTIKGSYITSDTAASRGKNPTDLGMAVNLVNVFNDGGHPIAHYGQVEFHANTDTNGVDYVDLSGVLQNYSNLAIKVNATAVNIDGSTQNNWLALEGSVDGENWLTVNTGGLTVPPKLYDITSKGDYRVEETPDAIGNFKAMGRWPYLRAKITTSGGSDNSGNQVKIVISKGLK